MATIRFRGSLGTAVEKFLLRVELVPWASAPANVYAAICATLERAGDPMGNLDRMIAAQSPLRRSWSRTTAAFSG